MPHGTANKVLLLTAPGVSAIAVVRLCGPGTQSFLQRHFSTPLHPDRPNYGHLTDAGKELDDPVILWNEQAGSADVCTHGGRWVVQAVLDLAQREGFELIDANAPLPAEATDTADPLEQEILQYLPLARTKQAVQTLLNQKEAWSLPPTSPEARAAILADRSLHYLLHPPRLAIIGIPNAGKSTLANALFGRERSIVSEIPGTTRDYVEDFANLSGLPVTLVDTPGLRRSADTIEMEAIAISQAPITSADLQILLLDPTQDPAAQTELIARHPHALLVSGKSDLFPISNLQSPISNPQAAPLSISARTGQGLPALDLAIRRHFGCETLPHARPCPWTDRQRQLLRSTP